MKSFPWRFAAYFLAGVYLFADLYACHGPLHRHLLSGRMNEDGPGGGSVAEVYGRPVTLLELQEAMRAHLWRRGEDWNTLSPAAQQHTRWLVAETLVNDRIIHAFRIMNGLDRKPGEALTQHEFNSWSRQFEEARDRDTRLAWQQLDEQNMQTRIRAAQEDQAWLDEKIAHRLAEITDADARRWFTENRDSLRIPAAYRAAHIYLTRHDRTKPDREPEIRDVHRRLTEGMTPFAALAAEFSEDERTKTMGGNLNWFTANRMPQDFIRAVEALAPGQTGAPVLTELGWHIIQLIERKPARLPEFDEVRSEVLAMLISERRGTAVQSLIAELRRRSMRPTRFLFYRPALIETALPAE